MGLFDDLQNRCVEIAGKAGIPPETVQSISASIQQKMTEEGASHMQAVEAVAAQHGLPVGTVQEVLSHCGSAEDFEGEMGNLTKGFLKL